MHIHVPLMQIVRSNTHTLWVCDITIVLLLFFWYPASFALMTRYLGEGQ